MAALQSDLVMRHFTTIMMSMHQVRLSLEAIRADVEEFGGKAYRMGKGSKDDAVVALLKDQLDEFKQVPHPSQACI